METLTFPEIGIEALPAVAPPRPLPAVAAATLKGVALAHFAALEQPMRALAERYRAVAFDVSTPQGLTIAKPARNDLRENGRYAIQRAEKAVKDEVNELKREIAPKVEDLIAIVRPVEDLVHEQIEARERQLAEERAERERIEAERVAKHRANIERLQGYGAQARGKTAEQIYSAITWIDAHITVGAEYEEFEQEACLVLDTTLATLRLAYTETKAREDEAARIKAQRIENERVAAEQAERQRQLDEQAAALRRQQEAFAAQESAAALAEQRRGQEAIDAAKDKAAAVAAAEQPKGLAGAARGHKTPEETTQWGAASNGAGDDAERDGGPASPGGTSPDARGVLLPVTTGAYAGNEAHAAQASPSGSGTGRADISAPLPTLNLGKLCDRLGFIVSAELLGTLGFAPLVQRSSRLFHEADFPRICAALAEHCLQAGGIEQGSPRLAPAARDVIDALNSLSDPEGELSCMAPGPEREELMQAWSGLCEALSATEGHAL